MKTLLKKNALFVFALLLALGTMSFTLRPEVPAKSSDPVWYYIPNESGQESNPSQYRPYDNESCPGSESVLCTIQAPDEGGLPDLTNSHSPTYKF
jgi:hypothetical protein